MKNILFILCFVLVGCQTKEELLQEAVVIPGHVSYAGIDINGDKRVCEEASANLTCTAVFGPEDQFAEDCRTRGFETVTCDCHDYICLEGSDSGMDIDGNHRTCNPMPADTTCTMVFTEEDQFGADCQASGQEAIQCGCHDWICKK